MITLLLISIAGVCSPLDWYDCDNTLRFMEDSSVAMGRTTMDSVNINSHSILFVGQYQNKRDCWGITLWQHEWIHVKYGSWHTEGGGLCQIREPYYSLIAPYVSSRQ